MATDNEKYLRADQLVQAFREGGMGAVHKLRPGQSDTTALFEYSAHLYTEIENFKAKFNTVMAGGTSEADALKARVIELESSKVVNINDKSRKQLASDLDELEEKLKDANAVIDELRKQSDEMTAEKDKAIAELKEKITLSDTRIQKLEGRQLPEGMFQHDAEELMAFGKELGYSNKGGPTLAYLIKQTAKGVTAPPPGEKPKALVGKPKEGTTLSGIVDQNVANAITQAATEAGWTGEGGTKGLVEWVTKTLKAKAPAKAVKPEPVSAPTIQTISTYDLKVQKMGAKKAEIINMEAKDLAELMEKASVNFLMTEIIAITPGKPKFVAVVEPEPVKA